MDDRQGISWEELQRKERTAPQSLPAQEFLLADKEEHLVRRAHPDSITRDREHGFILERPEHLFNRGELYNLSISKGTLTPEERYQINEHIIQTIIMLKQLPYPQHLAAVPDMAGSHHEKLDGTGYPRRLKASQLSLPARMMAIADVFEALTATDRPYKKGKRLSDAIGILAAMARDGHIDRDLFTLFLTSGAYLEYAREHLTPEQVDDVDVSLYLQKSGAECHTA